MSAVKSQPLLCAGHTRPVNHVSFSNLLDDGSFMMIAGSKDGTPMLRSMTGDWIGSFIGHKGSVLNARLSASTALAATGSADFSAKVWDTYNGECLYTFAHKHIVRAVAFSPQQSPQYLLTAGNEKKVKLFDLGRPEADPLILGNPSSSDGISCPGIVKSIVWDEAQGGVVGITAGDDGIVRWWDLRSLENISSLDLSDSINSMELVHGGGTLSIASGKTVHFLDVMNQHEPVSIPLNIPVSSVALHPRSRDRFVVGTSGDPWVRVYDLNSAAEIDVNKAHHGPCWSVAYSPDGEMYASGSEDGTIRLWQTNPGKSYGLWQGVDPNPQGNGFQRGHENGFAQSQEAFTF